MDEMMRILKGIEEDMQKQRNDMDKIKDTIIKDINRNIDSKFESIERNQNILENKIEVQQITIDRIEQHLKRKNLLFFGMEETEKSYNELENNIQKIITEKMKIPCERRDIELVKRIGKQTGQTRPIVLTLCTMGLKIQILKNRKYLENSKIYIKEDYTPKILQKRKELQDEFRARKEKGENVALRYDQIITLNRKHENTASSANFEPRDGTSSVRSYKRKTNSPLQPETLLKTHQRNIFQTAKKTKTIDSYIKSRSISQHSATNETETKTDNTFNSDQ